MKKETAFRTLERIAKIKSTVDRTAALREALANNRPLTILVQYTYHPDIKWKLPDGDLPDTIAKKSDHDEYAPLYQWVKKMYQFRDNFNMNQAKREGNFIACYESVAREDVEVLIGVKDKKLPWRNLGADFVMSAVPELFPPVPEKKAE